MSVLSTGLSREERNGASSPRTLTVAGVKQRYGRSRSKTYELLGEGRLRGVKMGTRLLIFTDSCEEVVAIDAATYIAAKYGLMPSTASTIATLAGIGERAP